MDKIPMTAAGYSALEAELKHCQQVERPRIIQQITDARTHGDLSENAEYHAAKETQSLNEGRIAELEDKLARAEVIDVSKLSGDTITFGATVTLVDEDTEKKAVWQIVGEPEADAKKGKISITSPLARALVGKKKGAQVEVVTPGGAKAYEVMKVEWKQRTTEDRRRRTDINTPGLPRFYLSSVVCRPSSVLGFRHYAAVFLTYGDTSAAACIKRRGPVAGSAAAPVVSTVNMS
jgi:transcription elongation factor GreA